jgi:Protein of unknown function (DUF3313)
MRVLLTSVASAAVLAFAGVAAADPVQIAPVALSERFQQELADDFGEREGPVLQRYIERSLERALVREGAQVGPSGDVVIETTLVDADNTKPTFAQLARNLGLDYTGSVAVGGAELTAVLRGADGRILAEINHKRYAWDLEDASLGGAWGDAYRSIRVFAGKVARAYRTQHASVQTSPS